MKNRIRDYPESTVLLWTNGTAAAVASGDVVVVDGRAGIAFADIAIGAEGTLFTEGRFELSKAAGASTSLASHQEAYYDVANKRVTATPIGISIGRVAKAASNDDTTVEVNLGSSDVFKFSHTVDGAEGAANALVVDTGFGVEPAGPVLVQVRSSAGAIRAGTSVVLQADADAGKISITNAALAVDDIVGIVAYRS